MAPFLRKGLQCFYCGLKSSQTYKHGLAQWQCPSCDAVNYLDANGDVTDPPAEAVNHPAKSYARTLTRGTSPLNSQSDGVFCQTCIKNQALKAQNLADYLPSTSDPTYTAYERLLPEYSRKLDERYPQVCADCAPRVAKRLQDAGYAAKTEFLRQRLDGSQRTKKTMSRWDLPPLLTYGGCIGWWVGLIGQMVWHVQQICVYNPSFNGLIIRAQRGVEEYFGMRSTKVISEVSLDAFARNSIGLAILCAWWNPSILHTSRLGPSNQKEYYKLQVILLIVRVFAMFYLQPHNTMALDMGTIAAVHMVSLCFDVVISLVSYRVATPSRNPSISLSGSGMFDSSALLKAEPTRRDNASTKPRARTFKSPSKHSTFPINQLSAQAPFDRPLAANKDHNPGPFDSNFERQVSSPSSEIADEDMMDLDPPIMQPRQQMWRSSVTGLTEAKQPLVANAMQGSSRMRLVQSSPRILSPITPPSLRLDEEASERPVHRTTNVDFAAPRFFASSTGETGLEGLMSDVFSLSDTPAEVRFSQTASASAPATSIEPHARSKSPGNTIYISLVSLFAALVGSILMYLAAQHEEAPRTAQFTISLALTALVSVLNLFGVLTVKNTTISVSDALLCIIQGTMAMYFMQNVSSADRRYPMIFVYASGVVQLIVFLRAVTTSTSASAATPRATARR